MKVITPQSGGFSQTKLGRMIRGYHQAELYMYPDCDFPNWAPMMFFIRETDHWPTRWSTIIYIGSIVHHLKSSADQWSTNHGDRLIHPSQAASANLTRLVRRSLTLDQATGCCLVRWPLSFWDIDSIVYHVVILCLYVSIYQLICAYRYIYIWCMCVETYMYHKHAHLCTYSFFWMHHCNLVMSSLRCDKPTTPVRHLQMILGQSWKPKECSKGLSWEVVQITKTAWGHPTMVMKMILLEDDGKGWSLMVNIMGSRPTKWWCLMMSDSGQW